MRKGYPGLRWEGLLPPQYLLRNRRFLRVVLNPPDYNPGSWIGAGNVILDEEAGEFWLVARLRRAPPARGYALGIYRSTDGEHFYQAFKVTKEELGEMAKLEIKSIEGSQMIRDPATGKYHLYISVDIDGWETLLLKAEDPSGPWECVGLVLRREESYETREARDPVIGIVDGLYIMLYRANDGRRINTALAVSQDGIKWRKLGIPMIDGNLQPGYLQLCGSFFAGSLGPIFLGLARRYVVNGCGIAKSFEAYALDLRRPEMTTIFRGEWKPLSPYEHSECPTHGYCSIIYDPFRDRVLMYVEAIDPQFTKEVGWRTQVDRLILYEVPLTRR